MRLQVIRFILTLFVVGFNLSPVQANDSDIVNCNPQFQNLVLGSSTAYGDCVRIPTVPGVGKIYRLSEKGRIQPTGVINLAISGFTTYNTLSLGFVPPSGRPSPVLVIPFTGCPGRTARTRSSSLCSSNDAANDYTLIEQQDNFERTMHLADSANIPVG